MRLGVRLGFAIILTATLYGCGAGVANDTPPTISQTATPGGGSDTVTLGSQAVEAPIPAVAGITGAIAFPAASAAGTLVLSASAIAPRGVALQSVHPEQSAGTLTLYEYVTIVPHTTISLPSIPAMKFTFPASTPIDGKAFYYGLSDPGAKGALLTFNTQGPAQVNGRSVSFVAVPSPLTLEAGHSYTFIVYATATTAKIFVANMGNNTVTSYNLDGTQSAPTIRTGLSSPRSLAVDAAGKIYVLNAGTSTITTYNPDGSQTTPTIASGLSGPVAVAVDGTGKIYVLNNNTYTVSTFNPDGSQTTPTISGLNQPSAMAVDSAGKVYITNFGYLTFDSGVTTYNANGSIGTPQIRTAYLQPQSIAVGSTGKIYVDYQIPGILVSYDPSGAVSMPTIGAGVPNAFAVDAAGKIYATNLQTNSVFTFDASGLPTTPTITTGLNAPAAIVVR